MSKATRTWHSGAGFSTISRIYLRFEIGAATCPKAKGADGDPRSSEETICVVPISTTSSPTARPSRRRSTAASSCSTPTPTPPRTTSATPLAAQRLREGHQERHAHLRLREIHARILVHDLPAVRLVRLLGAAGHENVFPLIDFKQSVRIGCLDIENNGERPRMAPGATSRSARSCSAGAIRG